MADFGDLDAIIADLIHDTHGIAPARFVEAVPQLFDLVDPVLVRLELLNLAKRFQSS